MSPQTWLEFADKNGGYAVAFVALYAGVYYFAKWIAPIIEGWSDATKLVVTSHATAVNAMATELPKQTAQLDGLGDAVDDVATTVNHSHEMIIQIHGHVTSCHPTQQRDA